MYAIIECGGKQYRVQEGDLLRVEKIDAEIGSTITIDKVFLLGGDKTVVGTPVVEGAKVTCKVMNQDKDKKILVFHYKAKKNIRKRYGHRQPFTSLLIEKIEKVKKAAKKATAESAEKVELVEA
jgi:large subunit ribosomal protein L21